MKLDLKIEFPCGYKYEVRAKAWHIDAGETILTECPLHGKKCRRKK